MNIQLIDSGNLEKKLTITLEPADYQPAYESGLKKLKNTVAMPGFRKGMVPAGMLKKMYGTQVLLDELNKVVQNSVDQYLNENQIKFFGGPMPDSMLDGEITPDRSYELTFSLGIQPEIKADFPTSQSRYKLIPAESTIQEYVENLQKQHFHGSYPEVAEADDTIFAGLKQLDENNNPMEGGLLSFCSFKPSELKDDKLVKEFTGAIKSHVTVVDLVAMFGSIEAAAEKMQKGGEQLPEIGTSMELTVRSILREGLHEINQELFDHVYGEGVVTTEEDFMARIKHEIGGGMETEANAHFFREVFESIYHKTTFDLPEPFLQRWLKENSKSEIKEGEFDAYFEGFKEDMRRNLVLESLLAANQVQITYDDLNEEAERYVRQYFAQYGMMDLEPGMLRKQADDLMQNERFYNQAVENAKNRYFADLCMKFVQPEDQEIPYEEFKKLTESK
ncbi:MAG: trigger factor [Bacteroidota bacterium]